MITGYDPDTRTLTTGLGDLLALRALPRTLIPSGTPLDIHRRQRAHAAFQRMLVREGWTAEIPLELSLERAGVSFHIRGRADLVRSMNDSDETDIELIEVKTLGSAPDFDDPLISRPRHVLQLYAYGLALQSSAKNKGRKVTGKLVYLPIGPEGGEPAEFAVDMHGPEVAELWDTFLHETASWLISEDQRRESQLLAMRTVQFPYDSFRAGQKAMIEAVDECLRSQEHLLLQAPTGTGKTAAVLSGALRISVPEMLALFFLTAKNTHKQMVRETVELLMKRGLSLRTIILTARETLCGRNRSTCFPDDCPFAPDFASRVRNSGVRELLLSQGVIGPEELRVNALEAGVCPFELGLCLSTECDVICGDYNYVFDPHVYLKRFFLETSTSSMCALLIDEAANLPSRAIDYYSPKIRLSWISSLLSSERISRKIRKLLKPWPDIFAECERLLISEGVSEIELPSDTDLPLAPEAWQRAIEKVRDPSRVLMDLSRSLMDFSRLCPERDPKYHLVFIREDDDWIIQWYCTDPSGQLSERMESCHSVVAFSATLSPSEHYAGKLGFLNSVEGPVVREVPYPFPEENLGVWIDPRIDTRYRSRSTSTPLLADRLRLLHEAAPGAWLIFLPSYSYLQQLEVHIAETAGPVLCQRREMSTHDREEFISEISAEDYLVLTVSGGVFAEGVDIRSDNLRGAVVVGPSLPGMDLRTRLLSESYSERGLNGFFHTWAIPGMTRVIQAAGRLIRNGEQRRMLVLMGKRFCGPPYFDILPSHWFNNGAIPILSDKMQEISSFYHK